MTVREREENESHLVSTLSHTHTLTHELEKGRCVVLVSAMHEWKPTGTGPSSSASTAFAHTLETIRLHMHPLKIKI